MTYQRLRSLQLSQSVITPIKETRVYLRSVFPTKLHSPGGNSATISSGMSQMIANSRKNYHTKSGNAAQPFASLTEIGEDTSAEEMRQILSEIRLVAGVVPVAKQTISVLKAGEEGVCLWCMPDEFFV